jgi:hypothetical protein
MNFHLTDQRLLQVSFIVIGRKVEKFQDIIGFECAGDVLFDVSDFCGQLLIAQHDPFEDAAGDLPV